MLYAMHMGHSTRKNPNTNPNTQRNVRLVLQDNLFQFVEIDYLQTRGTTMGTKMTVVFVNIFMSTLETKIIETSNTKVKGSKRQASTDYLCGIVVASHDRLHITSKPSSAKPHKNYNEQVAPH